MAYDAAYSFGSGDSCLVDYWQMAISNQPHPLHSECPKERSSAHCSSWRILTTYLPEWDSMPDCLRTTVFCIGPSLQRPMPDYSRWTLTIFKLQMDLNNLQNWEADWLMHFNPEKCKVIRITNKRKQRITPYYHHGKELAVTTKAKYLGSTSQTTIISIVFVRRQTTPLPSPWSPLWPWFRDIKRPWSIFDQF